MQLFPFCSIFLAQGSKKSLKLDNDSDSEATEITESHGGLRRRPQHDIGLRQLGSRHRL